MFSNMLVQLSSLSLQNYQQIWWMSTSLVSIVTLSLGSLLLPKHFFSIFSECYIRNLLMPSVYLKGRVHIALLCHLSLATGLKMIIKSVCGMPVSDFTEMLSSTNSVVYLFPVGFVPKAKSLLGLSTTHSSIIVSTRGWLQRCWYIAKLDWAQMPLANYLYGISFNSSRYQLHCLLMPKLKINK